MVKQNMIKKKRESVKIKLLFCLSILVLYCALDGRSPFRPHDPLAPTIIARWPGEKENYVLNNSHLQEGPYFNLFDKKHFDAHQLPSGHIGYRHNKNQMVTGQTLAQLIEGLLQEVKQRKITYTNFTVLKRRDFNTRDQTGLIIAKFNDYPFVVKLFIETPASFVQPLAKGFETSGLFMLGGGITRHLSGFTRIKNLEQLHIKVQASPYWKDRIAFPRKWYWLPKNNRWLEISGKNLGPEPTRTITIPATYALVCDYIDVERMFTLINQNDRRTAMNLSNYLKQNIDPHINNYAVEKQTHKIVPIDTEHFPTMVGYGDPPECKSYLQWYSHLGFKMIKDSMTRGKPQRREIQKRRHWPMEPFET